MPTTATRDVESLPGLDDLADAVLSLRTRDEARRFLRDLCTLPELEAMAHRWQVAKLLDEGLPYLTVSQRTGASTTGPGRRPRPPT